jgi:tetratricopeptide (TPR) repeat protein
MDGLRRLAARPRALAAVLAVVAAGATYAGTLGHGFALDDATEVVANDDVRSVAGIPRLFTRGAWAGSGQAAPIYRPLTSATYAVNGELGGLDPLGYHAVNVALHVAVTLALLALAFQLGLPAWAAALGALAFAVHPVHVEVVANVAGRKDELAALFSLLAVLAHARALRRGGARLALPALAALAALLSKESGAAAIAFCVAWDVAVAPGEARAAPRRLAVLYAGYALAFGGYLWARHAVVGALGIPHATIPFLENPLAHQPAGVRVLTAVAILGKGLGLLLLPRALSPDYSWNAIPIVGSPGDPRFLGGLAVIVALAVAALRLRRARPVIAFAALCYAASVFPASNLLVTVGTIFGERLLYLPSAAFCLAVAALAVDVARRAGTAPRRAAVAGAVLVLMALAGSTVAYAAAWRDEVSLFQAAVRAQPASVKAHALLGAALMEAGRAEEGVKELEVAYRAQAALPVPNPSAGIELGVAYERTGRLAEAEAVYAEVLRSVPEQPDALWRLGVVRWSQGSRAEAVRLWERTLAVAPDHARAMNDLGIAAYAGGDAAKAERLWLAATRADPRAAGPWLSLGALYEARGDVQRARDAWRRFLELARYGAYPGQREQVAERLRALDAGSLPARRP